MTEDNYLTNILGAIVDALDVFGRIGPQLS